jgi:hypothetical protein
MDRIVAGNAKRIEPLELLFTKVLGIPNVVNDGCSLVASATLVLVTFQNARPNFLPLRTL